MKRTTIIMSHVNIIKTSSTKTTNYARHVNQFLPDAAKKLSQWRRSLRLPIQLVIIPSVRWWLFHLWRLQVLTFLTQVTALTWRNDDVNSRVRHARDVVMRRFLSTHSRVNSYTCRSWAGATQAGHEQVLHMKVMSRCYTCRSWAGVTHAGHEQV